MTLKFDGWPRKIVRHLFYTTSRFVHHFKSIGEIKLELRSANAKFESKLATVCPVWSWNFAGWPWQMIRHLFNDSLIFVHHFKATREFKIKLQSGNAKFGSKSAIFVRSYLEIWHIISSKNNSLPLLCCFKFYTSIHSHQWIQTVQSGNAKSWSKSAIYCPVALKFDRGPWQTIEHLIYGTSIFVHHCVAIGEFKLELQFGNPQFGSKLTIFLSCMTLKFEGWHWQTIWHLFYATSICVHNFLAISEFGLE